MYKHSRLFADIDGAPLPVTHQELVADGVTLAGDGLVMRPLTPEDAQDYFAAIDYDREHLSQFGDTTAAKYPTVEAVAASIEAPSNPLKLRMGLWSDDNVFVGSENLEPIDSESAEVGYWIGKQHTGHHYASRGLRLLTDFAIGEVGYQTLVAKVDIRNTASQHVLTAAGYSQTDVVRDETTYIDGKVADVRRIHLYEYRQV